MNTLNEAVTYFKSNKGYTRLFNSIKQKYISFGEIKGNVVINKPTQVEKQMLSGLMKKDYSRNGTITINLKKLQQRLDESKFSGAVLEDILKIYYDGEITTKKENVQKKQNELALFWKDILAENENTFLYQYLTQSLENKDDLYANITRYYKKYKNSLKVPLLNACKGVNNLPKVKSIKHEEPLLTRIPVFASNITSNPHSYDKNSVCGNLFIILLCYINKATYPKNSEDLAELYYNNYLLVDDVSNMVLCKNITAITKKGKHKGLEGFNEYNEPIYLTLNNLSNFKQICSNGKYKKVIITENPAVFMNIIENCPIKDFPAVCTYGQIKLAGIVLLDLLVNQGFQLYYSGDLDPEGLQIADKLKQRYKENLTFLGFETENYYKHLSSVVLTENRLQKLEKIKSTELKELAKAIRKEKKATYEEEQIDYIVKFIETTFCLK